MPSRKGIKVWELLVAIVVVGGAFVFFVQAAERVRAKGHSALPTADMQEILQAAERYRGERGKWPTRAQDLKPSLARPSAIEGLAEGWYVVVWDELHASRSEAVLIYQKRVPTDGGYVCSRDGQVKYMTAEEARAALAASKE